MCTHCQYLVWRSVDYSEARNRNEYGTKKQVNSVNDLYLYRCLSWNIKVYEQNILARPDEPDCMHLENCDVILGRQCTVCKHCVPQNVPHKTKKRSSRSSHVIKPPVGKPVSVCESWIEQYLWNGTTWDFLWRTIEYLCGEGRTTCEKEWASIFASIFKNKQHERFRFPVINFQSNNVSEWWLLKMQLFGVL